jgi:hypothetical protein
VHKNSSRASMHVHARTHALLHPCSQQLRNPRVHRALWQCMHAALRASTRNALPQRSCEALEGTALPHCTAML